MPLALGSKFIKKRIERSRRKRKGKIDNPIGLHEKIADYSECYKGVSSRLNFGEFLGKGKGCSGFQDYNFISDLISGAPDAFSMVVLPEPIQQPLNCRTHRAHILIQPLSRLRRCTATPVPHHSSHHDGCLFVLRKY